MSIPSNQSQLRLYKDCTRMFIVAFNNGPKLQTKQLSINRGMHKQIVSIHTMRYYSLKKKELTTDTYNCLDKSQKCFATGKKPDTKEYTLYVSIYMKLKNGQDSPW